MKTDIEIADTINLKSLDEVAKNLGLDPDLLNMYGKHMAKIDYEKIESDRNGKLVLVSAMTPTPFGEGKTTMNIGLSMGLNHLGYTSISALREPSLGPCFGMKGGATGGGYAQVLPMEDINLHFTGDFHAITSAHNLLAAMVDNHIYHGNDLNIDPDRVVFQRVMDMNDRALRVIELEHRQSGFDITVASEVMAILCLSEDMEDLKRRLSEIIVGYTYEGSVICAADLKAVGAMAVLLKDAIKPNLVQTTENTPAIIHGGPFANIAHGCNSVIATKTALKLSDFTITEAGFGSDLGAEKFMNIKCRQSGLAPDVIVLVVTMRAIKYHGENFDNIMAHIDHLKQYGVPIVVSVNQFPDDSKEEIDVLRKFIESLGYTMTVSDVHQQGSKGAIELAQAVVEASKQESTFNLIYDEKSDYKTKIESIAQKVYGASGVVYDDHMGETLDKLQNLYPDLAVCMAKTQYSLSDNPKLLGRPKNFKIHISEVSVSRGAGFIVCLSGKILTMPGLPKKPAAVNMDYTSNKKIVGLF